MEIFINKYSLPLRVLVTLLGGVLALVVLWFLFPSKEASSPTQNAPQGTNLFGEVNFETNPLTIPWKK